jgi:hypothetical protein
MSIRQARSTQTTNGEAEGEKELLLGDQAENTSQLFRAPNHTNGTCTKKPK